MKKLTFTFFTLSLVSVCFTQIKQLSIPSDGIQLNAYIYQAPGTHLKPTIIWCHGNPGGKEEGKSKFAKRLSELGINVLRFNYRWLWGTEGIFTPGNSQRDLKNIMDYVLRLEISENFKIDTTRIIVAGYSHGSNVTIVSALHDDRIKEIICLGLVDYSLLNRDFFDPDNIEMKKFNQEALEAIWGGEIYGQGTYASDFDKFVMDMLFNNYKYDFVAQANRLMDNRIFIIVGMNDVTGPIEKHFFPLYRELKKMGHKNFDYKITESDHGFQELFDGTLSKMIVEWINER